MEMPLLRSNLGPSRVYENYSSRSSLSTSSKCQTGFISGRLVDREPDKTSLISRSREMSQFFYFLGFILNKEKSNLFPKQKITYIEGSFNFDSAVVTPPPDRIKTLFLAVEKITMVKIKQKISYTCYAL